MRKLLPFILGLLLLHSTAKAQPQFPCNGDFLFTRQITPSPNTYISKVNFNIGDITISNPGTITPAVNTNASVQYNGYVWTQDWLPAAFTLLRVASDYSRTSFTVAGMPASVDYNNAGVDRNGLMYILTNSNNPVSLFTINLSTGTPTLVSTKTVTGLNSTTDGVIWGDITIDPTTNRVYCWYHPTAATTSAIGLYEITNISTASPILVKIGVAQVFTLGSLFFNDRGQLFGYGSSTLGGSQDRIFAVNKATGIVSQYGIPDIAVSQSDGCECVFRVSLDRSVSVPIINVPRCGVDTFNYTITPRNNSATTVSSITFSDTLDSRLSYAFSTAALQTQLQAIYGGAVVVAISNDGGGTNNVVNITGMSIALGSNSFTLPVKVDANKFSGSATISEQAYLKGIAIIYGGPNEASNNPATFNPKDGTAITINLNGSKCLPPIADNFINLPMPQGNGATNIPGLAAADPDGTIASYKILTVPTAAEGILGIPCPVTPTGASCTGGFADLTTAVLAANPGGIVLTPAQAAAMRFDPVSNFAGNTSFTFNATDNSGNISNTATYILPVTSQPPVSNNIMENSMPNTNGPTTIQGLNSSDVDGTISSYQLTTLPTILQGVLSVPCPPNLTGGTCTAGFENLTAAVLANYPSGIPLTATQMAGMRFDPAAGFIGNATFNYNATDNSGNISNTANYTIPVAATITTFRPPLANNITAQPMNNNLAATSVPFLFASDLDGSIASYTITSVPSAAQGTLSISCPPTPTGGTCSAGFVNLTPAVLAANPAGILLTPAQSATVRFDPLATFTGNVIFGYTATDNTGLVSNPATYTIPVVNTPPTAVNIKTTVPFNATVTSIVPLSGSDADGTINNFTLTSVPTALQGTISVPCPPTPTGGTCSAGFVNLTPAVLAANPGGILLTTTQATAIRFTPGTGFTGSLSFNYTSTDNNSNTSTTAIYTITISDQSPIATDITAPVMPNTNAATSLSSLIATDPDGTIVSYLISSLPPATSGTLLLSGVPVTIGQVLTPAQITLLQFDPAANYTGVVNFTYSATDNSGNISNLANYNIPISGVGNLPPIAKNIVITTMPNTNGPTNITALSGTDPDGTIANYTLVSLPLSNEGVLSAPCPPTVTGATCTAGFMNLTAAVLIANPNGIVLTATQIAGLRFDPVAGFTSDASFTYFVTDNSGEISNTASYTIPVSGTPPVANPIVAPVMPLTNTATAIPALSASDADGTITNYTIETLPQVSQGILSIPCPPTPTAATCTAGFADLTAAVLTANPAGIILTPTQMAGMRFDPSGTFAGNVIFNYHATDNAGLLSNSTNYTIPVTGLPPVSNDLVAPKMLNTLGPTTIPGLISSDADGSIFNYIITSVPVPTQGILSVPCPPTPNSATCSAGFADITAAVLAANPGGISLNASQMANMRFDPNAGYNGNVIFNYAAYDNVGNISNVATYTIPTGSVVVLPVSLITFSGQRHTTDILLKWNTENEVNVLRYEIEYSIDGNNFNNTGNVNARNIPVAEYTHTLYNFVQPIYYFRLKIVDRDGRYTYSNTVVIRYGITEDTRIYPVPAKDFVNIEFTSSAKGEYTIQLINATGSIVKNITMKDVQAGQLITIPRNDLAKGVYILKLISKASGTTTTGKVIFN